MYRLTTPLQTFKFTTDTANFDEILITYQQNKRNLVEKHKNQLTLTTVIESGVTYYVASFSFTQQETKKFSSGIPCYCQVRVLTTTGQAWASQIYELEIDEVLNSGVLS